MLKGYRVTTPEQQLLAARRRRQKQDDQILDRLVLEVEREAFWLKDLIARLAGLIRGNSGKLESK